MDLCRIIDAAVEIPGIKNPNGGKKLHLKLTIQDQSNQLTTRHVQYISGVCDLLSGPQYCTNELPSVLQMVEDRLALRSKVSGLYIEEEIELTNQFVSDAKSFINFQPFNCAFGFKIGLLDYNTPYIKGTYRADFTNSTDFTSIEAKNVYHLVNILEYSNFDNSEIYAALRCALYDFERPDQKTRVVNSAIQDVKKSFAEEANSLAEYFYKFCD